MVVAVKHNPLSIAKLWPTYQSKGRSPFRTLVPTCLLIMLNHCAWGPVGPRPHSWYCHRSPLTRGPPGGYEREKEKKKTDLALVLTTVVGEITQLVPAHWLPDVQAVAKLLRMCSHTYSFPLTYVTINSTSSH